MVRRLLKQGHRLVSKHTRRLRGAREGFLLPVVILLGVGVGTISITALSSVSRNSVTLNDQYYNSVAKEAAQAGISAAIACKTVGDTSWSDGSTTTNLTPQTGCNGQPITGKVSTLSSASAYDSTYSVPDLQQLNTTSIVMTAVGKVVIKGPGGIAVKTISKSVRTFAKLAAPSSTRDLKPSDEISTNANTACVVSMGWAYCWGSNATGQLGTGLPGSFNSASPKLVANNTLTIGATPGTCVAWDFFGNCYSWSPMPTAAIPTNPMVGKTVTKISVGLKHTCAVASGKAYCWGDNSSGQLGNNSTISSTIPVAVDATAATAAVPGVCSGYDFFGNCTGYNPAPIPAKAASGLNGKTVTDITAGSNFTCAMTSDGSVACWGNNTYGQLGTNDRTSSQIPRAVYKHAYIPAVAPIPANPGVCDWYQWWGACGYYSVPPSDAVPGTPAVPESPFWTGKAVELAILKDSAQTMCAIMDTGKTACWGQNYAGQVGEGTKSTSVTVTTGCAGASQSPPAPPIDTSNDELQPVEVSTTLSFDSITITGGSDYGYVTAKTGSPASSSNPNRIYYWGGNTTVDSPPRTICDGGGGAGAGNNKFIAHTTRNYSGNTTPTGPQYDGSSGVNLDKKQIGIWSGIYNDLFCAQTGSDLYCDAHGSDSTQGQTGSNQVQNCYPVLWYTQCDPMPSGPQHVYMDGDLSGLSLQKMDTSTSGFTCILASKKVLCWGVNNLGQLGNGTVANKNIPTFADKSTSSDLGQTVTVNSNSAPFGMMSF